MLPRLSSRVSGFPVASPCLWGKLQNLSFSKISKAGCHVALRAGIALCDIPTCLITRRKCQDWRKSRTKCSFCSAHVSRLESLVFPVASPCLWGKLQTLSFSKVSKQVVMPFCVAGVALCDIPTCFIPCHKFFCEAGAIMRSTLFTLHFTLLTLHSTTPHSTLSTPPSRSTLYTLHSTIYTLDSSLHTLHSTLYTLHSTLYAPPHSTLYTPTLHHTLPRSTTLHHTLHFTHSSLHTLHSTLLSLHSTLHKLHFPLHTPQFTV